MRKLLSIKDFERFWKVFAEERRKERQKLRRLSFARKIAMVEEMQKMVPPKMRTRKRSHRTPFQRVSRLVGSAEGGIKDLGQRHRNYLAQRLRKAS
jgi:hypothetical protein